ncbi:MAG: TlpA family protein disulfide reductase [Planctomycetes bacterium]|nr:TlpA family protein disulfide reductase [Planctomycetota bacterium]
MHGVRSTLAASLLALLAGCQSQPPQPAAPAHDGPLELGTLEGMNGQSYDVDAELDRGETVALVFWQTWCESCEKEAPSIAKAAADNAGKIRFIGIVPGKDGTVVDSEVRATADTWGYAAFPHVRDRDMSLTRKLGVSGTPTILVLAKGGQVVFNGHRPPADWAPFQGAAFDASTAGGCEGGVCPLPAASE